MSVFDIDFAACALPAMMDHFGDAATYTYPNEDEVSLTGMKGEERSEIIETQDGRSERRFCIFTIGRDQSADFGGLDDAQQKGFFTIDGEYWAIDGIVEKTTPTVTFQLLRMSTAEVGRRGYDRQQSGGRGRK